MDEFNIQKILGDLRKILDENGFESANVVLGELGGIIHDKGTKGKFPSSGHICRGGHINLIPSDHPGKCEDELVVFNFDRDNLYVRLVEMVYHAGIYCRGTNRKVLFLTSKWDSPTYGAHAEAIDVLSYNGVNFIFVLIGKNGASLIPV